MMLSDLHDCMYELYDPEIATTILQEVEGETTFCSGNLSMQAISTFMEDHRCNKFCAILGLNEQSKDLKV